MTGVAPPPPHQALSPEALTQPSGPPQVLSPSGPRPALSPEAELWRSILNTTYEVGDACLEARILPHADVVACEPYLYTGLTALTVLQCLRQVHHAGANHNGTRVIARGRKVLDQNAHVRNVAVQAARLDSKRKLGGHLAQQLNLAVESLRGNEMVVGRLHQND